MCLWLSAHKRDLSSSTSLSCPIPPSVSGEVGSSIVFIVNDAGFSNRLKFQYEQVPWFRIEPSIGVCWGNPVLVLGDGLAIREQACACLGTKVTLSQQQLFQTVLLSV